MKEKLIALILALACLSLVGYNSNKGDSESKKQAIQEEPKKSLVDFFKPMPAQSPLVTEGIWGNNNVLPRDINNGIEDATLKNWCYWDGRIVKDDEGLYHIYASRWHHSFPHGRGWKEDSKGIHAVSKNVMGPYEDKGLIWPQWNGGKGSNVIGLRMHDGRYATVTSEITNGEVFVSESPNGPFELLGEIKVDLNGYDYGIARYNKSGKMSNVKIILRHDGRYMIVARSTAVMISDNGILGPYKVMSDRVYKAYPELPQGRNEDPTVWYSGGMYHIVYNHWPSKTSHHFSSIDGINDWKYRGIAFRKGIDKIFKYEDGTINDWEFVERPTAFIEDGHVTHFIFSVIDVHKGQDGANDNHASKIVVVPFDGVAFDKHMNALVKLEKQGVDVSPDIPDYSEYVNFGVKKNKNDDKKEKITPQKKDNQDVGILPTDVYGFETGKWWFKHTKFWSFTTKKFATGSKSLKFEADGTAKAGSNIQVHSPHGSKEEKIVLPAGDYILKAKVWLPDNAPKRFAIYAKGVSQFVPNHFKFHNVKKQSWEEVESNFSLKQDFMGRLVISVSGDNVSGANSTFYLDDISIEKRVR